MYVSKISPLYIPLMNSLNVFILANCKGSEWQPENENKIKFLFTLQANQGNKSYSDYFLKNKSKL